jgi:stress response protein SCP2
MNYNEITLQKRLQIFNDKLSDYSITQKDQIQLEVMSLGYVFSQKAIDYVDYDIYKSTLNFLRKLKGSDKVFQPLSLDFLQEVIDQDSMQIVTKNIEQPILKNTENTEDTKYQMIDLADSNTINEIYSSIVCSNISLNTNDSEILIFLLNNLSENTLNNLTPKPIPFKELSCLVVAEAFKLDYTNLYQSQIRTATDVLRVATAFSKGDISLATNTKFKLSNKERRFIVTNLEPIINQDEIAKNQNKWIHLFHTLHIGTYKEAVKCNQIAKLCRETRLSNSYNSNIESAISNKDVSKIIELVDENSGDIIRRLDKIFRDGISSNTKNTNDFHDLSDTLLNKLINKSINTRVLIQAYNHFLNRGSNTRLALAKSIKTKAKILPNLNSLDKVMQDNILDTLKEMIKNNVKSDVIGSFSNQKKIYIDERLKDVPMPTSMRNLSSGIMSLPRGARLPMFEHKTKYKILRFFIWWTCEKDCDHSDLDLSSLMLNKNFEFVSQVSYTNLKNDFAYHSGDITHVADVQKGACEFIDIDLSKIPKDVQYLSLDIRQYSGIIKNSLAGWMERDEVGNINDVFEPQTVKNLVQVSEERNSKILCLFDLYNEQMIWTDVDGSVGKRVTINSLSHNTATATDLIKYFASNKHLSIYDFLELKFKDRQTDDIKQAQIIYSLDTLKQFQTIIDFID